MAYYQSGLGEDVGIESGGVYGGRSDGVNTQGLEVGAAYETERSDFGDVGTQGYGRQLLAAVEDLVAERCYGTGNVYGIQRGAVLEGEVGQHGQLFG